jgi:hypothetical protein
MSTGIKDLFTATLLGDRRTSTNCPWNRFEFRRLVDARSDNEKRRERRGKGYLVAFLVLFFTVDGF